MSAQNVKIFTGGQNEDGSGIELLENDINEWLAENDARTIIERQTQVHMYRADEDTRQGLGIVITIWYED